MSNYPQRVEVVVHFPATRAGWDVLRQRVTQLHTLPTGDSMDHLVWNVIYHDSNAHKIGTFNVFDHCGFMKDVQQHLRKFKDKALFAEELKRSVKYYFWSKCEWEIIISPWTGSRDTEAIKVDVCWQLLNNWERFVDYVWNSKRRRTNG